jgi:hypothetical protein
MSAQGQAVQISFKISSDSLNKLQKVMSGKGSSSGSGGAGGLGKGMAQMQKMGIGGIAKLAGIAGGIGILVGLIKKVTSLIFDSSPMLKQIMNLMNFGLMLIFRPIGDFIGFMLRPIVVLLLRQVIIPFYRDILPIAREFGDFLGGGLVELWEDPSTFIADAINATGAWAQEQVLSMLDGTFDWEGFGTAVLEGALTFIKALPIYKIEKLIFEVLQKIDWSGVTKGLNTIGDAFGKAVGDRLQGISTMIQQPFLMFIGKVNMLLLVTLPAEFAKFQQTISNIWIQIQQPFLMFIGKINMFFLVTIPNWFKNIEFPDIGELIRAGATDAWGTFTGAIGFADGGQINEPIFGMGKSGQTYTFGERGSETIIPNGESDGGGGTTINISIGNISSEGDMAAFERRVTEVLESVNSRRGRT